MVVLNSQLIGKINSILYISNSLTASCKSVVEGVCIMADMVVIMVYWLQGRPRAVVFHMPLRLKSFALDAMLHLVHSLLSIEAMSNYFIGSGKFLQLNLHVLMLGP